jgi:hypothetical protein
LNVRTRSTSEASHTNVTKPFFSVQRAPAPSFFSQSPFAALSEPETEAAYAEAPAAHVVQRKCAACEAEKKILPQLEIGPVDDPLETEADVMADHVVRRQAAGTEDDEDQAKPLQAKLKDATPPAVQRKCAACEAEKKILPQIEVGPVDDPLETEADMMADHVVRRQAFGMDDDGRQARPLQAKAEEAASSESASSGLESALAGANGSGGPLASHTRDEMEDAFGADFSAVRVHTGAGSAAMNDQIGARAFTYGSDIHFNDGEFAPGTERGTRLLAHELTHVVQQNSGVRRAPKRVQAKLLVFGPPSGIPSGTQIHGLSVLPLFKATGINEGLWIEPAVPGANKGIVGRGLAGNPDFYRDNAPNGVPIGINIDRRGKPGRIRGALAVAAPRAPITRDGPVRDLANAPRNIELGDLKPGHSPEEQLGSHQISSYSTGIKETAKAVNDYQERRGYTDKWDPLPNPQPMAHLVVPDRVATSSPAGVAHSRLDVWEWRSRAVRYATTSLMGSLIVYKSPVNGIWAYEWMPENVPETLGDDFDMQRLLNRLNNDVQPRLQSATTPTPKLKDSPAAAPQRPPQQSVRRLLRRKPEKHKKFDEKAWLAAYNPWRAEADTALGESKTKKNEAVLEALTEGKKRTGFDPGIPQKVQERAKGFEKVRHWVRYGKLYGWFRKTFDRVYVKLAGFAQKVKEKVKNLVKSGSNSSFGNWIKAAALALFKVAKKLGAWAVSIILDKLLNSLQEGVINIVKQLAEAATPESVKSKIEEFEELKAKYEQMLQEAEESLENRLFGDKLDLFSKLDTVMQIANTVSTIVSVVKWGIRVVACASPPLLGCLWNLAVAALEYAFSKIMETCWFSEKVYGWVEDAGSVVKAILDFPTKVAQTIANNINDVLKLPDGIGPLFAEIKISHKEFHIHCGGGGGGSDGEGEGDSGGGGPEPTEEQKALMDLAKEFGDGDAAKDKLEAFLEMAAKRAADSNVALDADRIRKLGPLIRSLTIEQMKQIAANRPVDGIPVPVEEFLKSIATLTPAESERKAARKIDYDKAQHSNASFEKNEIGWKPALFVKPDIASDSKEFADAIYDIQQMLGIKADGMAGPKTTKAFYEHNKQPKDQAYANAVTLVKQEEQAREEMKETAERKKEYEALLKDEKIKAAMAAPFPSEDQLKQDLTPLSWDNLDDDSIQFIKVKGRGVMGLKTSRGQRAGCYFNYVERDFRGATLPMIVKTSRFYALDEIPGSAVEWATFDKDGKREAHFWFILEKKGTFFDGLDFFGQFVRIQ